MPLVQNKLEKYVKYMDQHGEHLTPDKVAWSCGCSVAIIPPKETQPGIEMGVGYVINPCEKHPTGWDLVSND